ncbi:MAG: hypothetical protein R3F39_24335 [Myxococcota bacterium]
MSTCETHPTESAIGACARCGRFVCRQCNRGNDGRMTCPVCSAVSRADAPAKLPAPQHQGALSVQPLIAAPPARLAPNPFPERPAPTRAQKLAWIPIAGGAWTFILGVSGSLVAVICAVPLGAASLFGAHHLWKKHKLELFEHRALGFFRALTKDHVTKDEAVKDHGLDPKQADQVLKWLVGQDLLVADWDDLDRPVVYRRQSS